MAGCIGVDRSGGIYVHETDKKSIDAIKMRKVDRSSVLVREWTEGKLGSLARARSNRSPSILAWPIC